MFVSLTKYLRKCSSFYGLIVSQDNAYKNCLLIRPKVRDQGKINKSVSVKVRCC